MTQNVKNVSKVSLRKIKYAWALIEEAFSGKPMQIKTIQEALNLKYYTKGNDRLAIFSNKNRLIFCFEQTNDFKDWLSNIKKDKVSDGKYGIHEGFYKSAKKFRNIIYKELMNSKNKKIGLFGFSRGAALATESARFVRKHRSKIDLIVFASPRVGGGLYKNLFENDRGIRHCHVHYKNDIVTKVPFKKEGFRHIKKQELIMKSKWWHKIPFLFKIKLHLSTSEIMDYQ